MEYRSVKGFNGWGQLGIIIAFLGVGIIFCQLSIIIIGLKALGPSILPLQEKITAIPDALLKPVNSVYAQWAQIFGVLFLMFLPSVAFIFICHKNFSWAGFSKYFTPQQILIGAVIIFTTSFFADPFEDLTKLILSHFPHWDRLAKNAEDAYNSAVDSMTELRTWPQFITGIFIIAFLPAMFEEFFFRGVLQNLFVRWWKRPIVAITFISLLFSLVHASYYLFISRFILGFALGLLFYYSKNIWVNIFAHFMNNLMALTQLFYINNTTTKKVSVNAVDPKLPLWSVFISFAILGALFIYFDKISKANRERIELQEVVVDDTHQFIN